MTIADDLFDHLFRKMNYTLRDYNSADDPFLRELFAVCRPEFDLLDLPIEQKAGLLTFQRAAREAGYRENFPNAGHRIILFENQTVGRIMCEWTARSVHLIDVALLPSFQSRGIGTRVLTDLIRSTDERKISLTLNVEATNRAQFWYARLGFLKVKNGDVYFDMERTPAAEND